MIKKMSKKDRKKFEEVAYKKHPQKEKETLSNKQKIYFYISIVINFIIAIALFAEKPNTPWWYFVIIFPLAYAWSKTSRFGEKIFKMFTPQIDYISRSRFDLFVGEMVATFGISCGIFFAIAAAVITSIS
jgi:hypothetical protein